MVVVNLDYKPRKRDFVVVRHENLPDNKLIIWSKNLDKYLRMPNAALETQVLEVLKRKQKGIMGPELYSGIPLNLEDDLIKLGFNGPVKEWNSSIEGRLGSPLETYFDYTTACNFTCKTCYNRDGEFDISRGGSPNITMPPEQIVQVLEQMAANAVMRAHVAGGEPTAFKKHLQTYFATSKRLGINQSIVTNGSLLDDERCAIIIDNDLVTATVSFDGFDAQSYGLIRHEEMYPSVLEGITRLVNYRNTTKSETLIQLRTVWDYNTPIEHLEKITLKAIELGVDAIQFHCPERCMYHEPGHYGSHVDEYYQTAIKIEELKEKYSSQIQVWNVWNPVVGCAEVGLPNMTGCVGAQELIAIQPTGEMSPCLMDPHKLGNLFQDWDGNFADFWSNSERLIAFQGLAQTPDPYCASCKIPDYCRQGSIVRQKVEHGLELWPGKRDPLCPSDYIEKKGLTPQLIKFPSGLSNFEAIVVAHSL